ncbi:nucleotidyl transferase [Salinadaptatus halalkaliphilus]|uniref:Bifunctional protein GlmU n=1 Tax=Salinadaptatus halalkaliphilus TaxID=2419781 RepID=A0A4S3TLG7_9EURY|nr:sugar phosphate nucleotidyltransferase [Salinadaptatus halalkaliphilus]THE64450.1 nucleotidyl transferase [Salinadaptatus halalkaliphilus]
MNTAIVLAAGEGTRLRPLTRHRPKPMLPVLSKTILEHVFNALIESGVTEIIVVVGYKRNRIQSHFGSSHRNVPLTYVVQERQLGTGHALLKTRSHIDETCVVINGDQIVGTELIDDVVETHQTTDAVATLGLLNRTEIGEYGGVLLEDNSVSEIIEGPQDDRNYRLNTGVYALEPSVVDTIEATPPSNGEHLLTDAFRKLVEDGEPVRGVVSDGLWVDVAYPWDLLDATERLIDDIDWTHDGKSAVNSSAILHETAVISPSAIIEANCEIEPGAVIGPNVSLGQNVTVGTNAVVERSVVDTDARIGQNATLVDCIVGQGARIGAGTVAPGGPSSVQIRNRVYEDVQLGALLADRVYDGGGSTYVPGTVVGADATIHSGATISGTIGAEAEVYP